MSDNSTERPWDPRRGVFKLDRNNREGWIGPDFERPMTDDEYARAVAFVDGLGEPTQTIVNGGCQPEVHTLTLEFGDGRKLQGRVSIAPVGAVEEIPFGAPPHHKRVVDADAYWAQIEYQHRKKLEAFIRFARKVERRMAESGRTWEEESAALTAEETARYATA